MSNDYHYPGTTVLRNRLGYTDPHTLAQAESVIAATRMAELAANPIDGHFDFTPLQAIHRHLLGDLYEWAGKIRTKDIAPGDLGIFHDPPAAIPDELDRVFTDINSGVYLNHHSHEGFVHDLAGHWGDLTSVHPFVGGNSRTQRVFRPTRPRRRLVHRVARTQRRRRPCRPQLRLRRWRHHPRRRPAARHQTCRRSALGVYRYRASRERHDLLAALAINDRALRHHARTDLYLGQFDQTRSTATWPPVDRAAASSQPAAPERELADLYTHQVSHPLEPRGRPSAHEPPRHNAAADQKDRMAELAVAAQLRPPNRDSQFRRIGVGKCADRLSIVNQLRVERTNRDCLSRAGRHGQ